MILNPISNQLLKRVARHRGSEAYQDLIALLELSKMNTYESITSLKKENFEKTQGMIEQIDSVINTMRNAMEEAKLIDEQIALALQYSKGDKVVNV